jgi:UDP-glucuronate 4-epimerase
MDFIQTIEQVCGKEAIKIYLPMQQGDVYQTNADTSALENDMNYKPAKQLYDGIKETITWFKQYYTY